MKHYYQYSLVSVGENGWSMVELDEQFVCLRAIYKTSKEEFTTNFKETNDFGLPEGALNNSFKESEKISLEKFNETWSLFILKHQKSWNEIKERLKVGSEVNAKLQYFYPQGVILDIEEKFMGIAEYDKCLEVLGTKRMYPENRIMGKIKSFDDENMWIELTV